MNKVYYYLNTNSQNKKTVVKQPLMGFLGKTLQKEIETLSKKSLKDSNDFTTSQVTNKLVRLILCGSTV